MGTPYISFMSSESLCLDTFKDIWEPAVRTPWHNKRLSCLDTFKDIWERRHGGRGGLVSPCLDTFKDIWEPGTSPAVLEQLQQV